MITDLQRSVFSASTVTNISKSFTYNMAAKTSGIYIEQNYVIVTLCIRSAVTDVTWCVCLSVCLYVHEREPYESG